MQLQGRDVRNLSLTKPFNEFTPTQKMNARWVEFVAYLNVPTRCHDGYVVNCAIRVKADPLVLGRLLRAAQSP